MERELAKPAERELETCGERVRDLQRESWRPVERELETCGEKVRNLWRERELAKPSERES